MTSFKTYIAINEARSKIDLKSMIQERKKIYSDLKSISGIIAKKSRKDFKLALELLKPQNTLMDVNPKLVESVDNKSLKKFIKSIDLLGKHIEKMLYLPNYGPEEEKKIKTDFENISKAFSLLYTVEFKDDRSFNEGLFHKIDNYGQDIMFKPGLGQILLTTGAGAAAGGPLGAILGFAYGYGEYADQKELKKKEREALQREIDQVVDQRIKELSDLDDYYDDFDIEGEPGKSRKPRVRKLPKPQKKGFIDTIKEWMLKLSLGGALGTGLVVSIADNVLSGLVMGSIFGSIGGALLGIPVGVIIYFARSFEDSNPELKPRSKTPTPSNEFKSIYDQAKLDAEKRLALQKAKSPEQIKKERDDLLKKRNEEIEKLKQLKKDTQAFAKTGKPQTNSPIAKDIKKILKDSPKGVNGWTTGVASKYIKEDIILEEKMLTDIEKKLGQIQKKLEKEISALYKKREQNLIKL